MTRESTAPFICVIAPVLVALAAACGSNGSSSAANVATPAPFPEPASLSNTSSVPGTFEASLTAAPAQLELVAGTVTNVYAYNGSVPGPTIDVNEGDHVVIHFTNQLPDATTVHWHGLHIPADQDGNPQDAVAPGASRDYVFDLPAGSAGTYWYHPHPQGKTAQQTEMGLEGVIRVHAKNDPLPPDVHETLLFLSDNTLDGSGRIAPASMMDQMNGREGDTVFVNGLVQPTLVLRAGEVRRLRVVNGSDARYYLLAVPGHTLRQIGTDGGLFAMPQPRDQILLAPAERIEVLLAATADPGTQTMLRALPYDRGAMTNDMSGTLTSSEIDLVSIQYMPDPAVTPPVVSGPLRQVDPIDTSGAGRRAFTLTEQMMQMQFQINGASFDPSRVDQHAALGSTEIWTLDNQGDMDHPFHLHGFQFQVLDRNGVPEPAVAWKDTVNLRKKDVLRIAVELGDFPGMRMYHCHILEHEDAGMMGMIDVE
jgi:bilirubin oxidase